MARKQVADRRQSWIEDAAGLMPVSMLAFALSAMIVYESGDGNGGIDGSGYVAWLSANASTLRVVLPLLFAALFVFAAIFLVKRWRDFAIFPSEIEDRVELHVAALWPLSVIAMIYLASLFAYAHYVWIYEGCGSVPTFSAGAQCALNASAFSPTVTFATDQFVRGIFGDFFELIGPIDPAHRVAKDEVFIIVTGLYRLFGQTALVVAPLAVWTCGSLVVRRIRHATSR